MADFPLVIDLTGPQDVEAEINGGNASTENVDVSLAVATSDAPTDGYEIKVWGSIDPTDPGNASYGESEGAADWIPLTSPLAVRVSAGGGQKTLNVRLRDDVHNESDAVSDAIMLIGPEPPVPEPVPAVPKAPPAAARRPKVKRVAWHTEAEIEVEWRVRVKAPILRNGIKVEPRFQITGRTEMPIYLRAETAVATTAKTPAVASSSSVVGELAVHRTPVGPETEAALVALGVL